MVPDVDEGGRNMNILVVGNGFDIAHGLPTTYGDFLMFTKALETALHIREWGKESGFNRDIESLIEENKKLESYPKGEVWKGLIEDNIWLEFFYEWQNNMDENWIDFENVILQVIRSIELDIVEDISELITGLSAPFFDMNFNPRGGGDFRYLARINKEKNAKGNMKKYVKEEEYVTFKDLRNLLLTDLHRLISAFELYLTEYVNAGCISLLSPDIRSISYNIDAVLSFNYTKTYAKLYDEGGEIDYDFIHGEVRGEGETVDDIMDANNMVLGIDEYLPDDERNKKVDFIEFKKFYQRIHKETGCKYKNWMEEIDEVYIFGHSLDTTDGDTLRDLILNDYVDVTIFYVDKKRYGQQIANLVKVIGQEELIRRTGGSWKNITFKKQQKMVVNTGS